MEADLSVDPLKGIVGIDDYGANNYEDTMNEVFGASTVNPNKNDDRRLFQECKHSFSWDPKVDYGDQPNPIAKPTELVFPDHFLQVEGGINLIYWEKERSIASTCSIIYVDEENGTFLFHAYGWHGKKRKTFFDTGRTVQANESDA